VTEQEAKAQFYTARANLASVIDKRNQIGWNDYSNNLVDQARYASAMAGCHWNAIYYQNRPKLASLLGKIQSS